MDLGNDGGSEVAHAVGRAEEITRGFAQPALALRGGCTWDAIDDSSSFDTVFMVLLYMYSQSSTTWRNIWKGESPEFNQRLAADFDALLTATATDTPTSTEDYSATFTSYRDTFRQHITASNPNGPKPIPVVDILRRILSEESTEPTAIQTLTCGAQCPLEDYHDHKFDVSSVFCDFNLALLRRHEDPPNLPMWLAVSRFIEDRQKDPYEAQCEACGAQRNVTCLYLPETTWTWFKTHPDDGILPSLNLTFSPKETQPTHLLQGIIYHGDDHLTARMRTGWDIWWEYDSQWPAGKPRLADINGEADLMLFGTRRPVFLIYRHTSF